MPDQGGQGYSPASFLLSKLSSISTLFGSRRKICQRALFGTWFTIKGAGLNEMPVGASGQRPEICIADGSFAQPFLTTISSIVKCLGTSRLTAALLERLANEPHVRLFFYTDDNVRFTGRKPYGMKSAAAPWPCWNGGMS